MNLEQCMLVAAVGVLICACQPSESPPDLLKTQRDVLNKAKGLEGQMQQQAQDRMQSADEASK